jgi:succinoglycan biosynthesis protein ExoH
MRLVGVLACWGVFQLVALTGFGAAVARYGGFAFFLHAIHFPLIAAVKIFLWSLVPAETQSWMLVHYAMSVLVTVSVGIAFGLALTKVAPKTFAFLNGGRSAA